MASPDVGLGRLTAYRVTTPGRTGITASSLSPGVVRNHTLEQPDDSVGVHMPARRQGTTHFVTPTPKSPNRNSAFHWWCWLPTHHG